MRGLYQRLSVGRQADGGIALRQRIIKLPATCCAVGRFYRKCRRSIFAMLIKDNPKKSSFEKYVFKIIPLCAIIVSDTKREQLRDEHQTIINKKYGEQFAEIR